MKRAVIVAVLCMSLLLAAGGSAATSTRAHWRATDPVLPANAATGANRGVQIHSVSCASAGNCSAVGSYQDSSGNSAGLLLTENAGKWRRGVEATPPGNVKSDTELSLVSCASAGNCSAVGSYTDGPMFVTEKAGHWETGRKVNLPANAWIGPYGPLVFLESLSCASAGNCAAVGSYEDTSQDWHGLLLTEKAGRWRTGVAATLPSNADPAFGVILSSVSCASAGNCSAVGFYNSSDYYAGDGVLLSETRGRWHAGVEAVMPKDAIAGKPVSLTSVSCGSARNCSAVGTYDNDEGSKDPTTNRGVLLIERAGKWQAGIKAEPPANSVPESGGSYGIELNSVSCPSAGNCVAVGEYSAGPGDLEAMMLTEKAGNWQRGVEALPPANGADLSSVSCASPGNCAAVGYALVVTEKAGRWTTGTDPQAAEFAAVSCAAPLSCSAVGRFGSSNQYGLLIDTIKSKRR